LVMLSLNMMAISGQATLWPSSGQARMVKMPLA